MKKNEILFKLKNKMSGYISLIKKYRKKSWIYLIILFFIIISHQTKFFSKTYILLTKNYEERIKLVHGECYKIGAGFVRQISNKYKIKPRIYSYIPIPSSYWLIDNKSNNKKINEKYIVLLNYSKNLEYYFIKNKESLFVNQNRYDSNVLDGVKNIKILLKKQNLFYPFMVDFYIDDFVQSKKYSNYSLNLKKFMSIKIDKNNSKIKNGYLIYNFKSNKYDFGTRNKEIYIKIEPEIAKSLTLELQNRFLISNYDILENKDNCYFFKND